LNLLNQCTLTGVDRVEERTFNYWKGLGLPAFLFCVVENLADGRLDCYNKRYTPLLDGFPDSDDEIGSKAFYQVSSGTSFLAYADRQSEIGGFARDLIVD
jgi:hypothetical protein